MPHATATFYRLANRIYALERVKVAVNGTISYTRFLVSVPQSYMGLFADRLHTSKRTNDVEPPYPVPIYSGSFPAPTVKRVLPGDVALQTSELEFTMLRGDNVGVFGDRAEPSLLFLYAERCDPCDEDLQAIARQAVAMRRAGMSIYMVVPSSASVASGENALRRFGVSRDITIIRDRYGALFAYLGTNTMPRNYIFSHEGTVAVARMGSFPDGELQRALLRAGVNLGLSVKE